MVIGDCNIGSLVFVAHTAVCRALSGTLRTPAAVI
jgi:carbonic anhydrase/acetyltransferase-like protein (isoleucine patch superfamily)